MSVSKARESLELRPIKIQKGLLDNHDGSCIFAFGSVMALAGISGPSEVRIRDELTDRATLDIHHTPLQGIPGVASLAFTASLVQVYSQVLLLHLHPRSLVQINLQTYSSPPTFIPLPILHAKKKLHLQLQHHQSQIRRSVPHPDSPIPVSLQAAHINAITCACLDASVHMNSIVASISAVTIRNGIRKSYMKGWRPGESAPGDDDDDDDEDVGNRQGHDGFEILLDPSPYEESLSKSQHVLAFAFTRDIADGSVGSTFVYNESRGAHSTKEYLDILKLGREACKSIAETIRTNSTSGEH